MPQSYKLCVLVLHLTLDVILGSLFSQTLSALSNLYPALVSLNTSKPQSNRQLLCVCDTNYDRTWLIPEAMDGTKVSYAAGLLNLCQHMQVLTLKMAGSHFFLTSAAHLFFHTSLSQVTTGQSKCLCIRTNGWEQQEGNRIRLANSAANIGVATECHLCPSVMLSRFQVWLRVRAINDVMFVQQHASSAKPFAQRGRTSPGF